MERTEGQMSVHDRDLQLTAEAVTVLNAWSRDRNITTCPACHATHWGRWRVFMMETPLGLNEPHYARACANCGQLQIFRAAIVLPFTYNQLEDFVSFVPGFLTSTEA